MSKILLIEDNEANRDALSRHLKRRGYEVVMAVDGQAGDRHDPFGGAALILMDMSLPVLDGWEATRRSRPTPRRAPFPSSP
jgi:FOG: CheY-like receiver